MRQCVEEESEPQVNDLMLAATCASTKCTQMRDGVATSTELSGIEVRIGPKWCWSSVGRGTCSVRRGDVGTAGERLRRGAKGLGGAHRVRHAGIRAARARAGGGLQGCEAVGKDSQAPVAPVKDEWKEQAHAWGGGRIARTRRCASHLIMLC